MWELGLAGIMVFPGKLYRDTPAEALAFSLYMTFGVDERIFFSLVGGVPVVLPAALFILQGSQQVRFDFPRFFFMYFVRCPYFSDGRTRCVDSTGCC